MMNQGNNNWFEEIRVKTFNLLAQKKVDIEEFLDTLGVTREKFVENYSHDIHDFPFYIEALLLLENWEG